jgi:hypothetical protein
MKPRYGTMMRCIVGLLIGIGMALPTRAPAADVTTVAGVVTYLSSEVVEVSGRRGLIGPGTTIFSEGRQVSIAAVHVGMPAELEIGSTGQALMLQVKGAVE